MRSEDKLLTVAWLALISACVLPLETLESVSLCLFRGITGIPCPGCGMGHALYEFFNGDWLASFAYHPLGPILALAWSGRILSLSVRGLLYNPAYASVSRSADPIPAHGDGPVAGSRARRRWIPVH